MISVRKDYDQCPPILRSADTHAAILQLLRVEQAVGFPRLDILMHQEVLEALLEVYHGKCALTERKISLSDSTVFLMHYRPLKPYYWLCFEWSNLMPVSDDSTLFREQVFPLRREKNRVLQPPKDRVGWQADAAHFLAEEPLLLNPEQDEPEQFIYFDRQGLAQPVNQNQRGTASINIYTLNFGQVVVERKRKIERFQDLFARQVTQYKKVYVETTPSDTAMNELFVEPFEQLQQAARPEEEFSLLGQNMLQNFDYFFTQTLPRAKDRRILRNAFEVYANKNLKESPIQLAQTRIDDEQEHELVLQGFEVCRLKGFDDLKLWLYPKDNLHVIAGTNGTGKSAVLQLLALVLSGLPRPPMAYSWGHLRQGEQEGFIRLLMRRDKKSLQFTFFMNAYNGLECRQHRAYYETLRAKTLVLGYGLSETQARYMKGRYKAFSPIAALFGDISFLHTLEDDETFYFISDKFEEIKTLLNPILSQAYADREITLEDFDREHLYFRTTVGRQKDWDMPRSFRAAFAYLLDMLFRFNRAKQDLSEPETIKGIVLIDEIDYVLTNDWQRVFFPMLASTFPAVRFIVSTQNPFVIQSVPHRGVTLFTNEDGHTVTQPFAHDGQVWAWTTTQVTMRLLNSVMEISPLMDQKLSQLHRLLAAGQTDTAQHLLQELQEALPQQSPYHDYLEEIVRNAGLSLE